MALRYLLDTNTTSDLVRRPQGPVAGRIDELGEDSSCTSIIVAAELRYGADQSGSERLAEALALLLSGLETMPLEPPADQRYAAFRHHLGRQGTLAGPNALGIAAHALATDLTFATSNPHEFERVPSLRIQNWWLE